MQVTKLTLAAGVSLAALFSASAYATDIDLTGYTKRFSYEASTLNVSCTSPKGTSTWYGGLPYLNSSFSDSIWDCAGLSVDAGGILHVKAWLPAPTINTTGNHAYGVPGMKSAGGTALVSGVVPGTARTDAPGWYAAEVGFKFTVNTAVNITQVGWRFPATPSNDHRVRIVDDATGADLANGAAVVPYAGATPNAMNYVSLPGTGVTLASGHTYELLGTVGFGEQWTDDNTTFTPWSGMTVVGSAYSDWHSGAMASVDPTGAGFTQQYGYFEARVKMPSSGTGAWPAFWMLTNTVANGRTVGEEIDNFEYYGVNDDPNNAASACTPPANHAAVSEASHNWNNGNDTTPPAKLYAPCTAIPNGITPWTAYHIYGVRVDSTNMTWFIDGTQVNQVATPTDYLLDPFYLLVDYGLGGGWPLTGMVNPSEMLVDWVRVYTLPGAAGSFSANPSTVSPGQASVLKWDFGSATSCRPASGNFTAGTGPKGSATVKPTASEQYTLMCSGDGGNVMRTTTVTVN